MTRLCLPLALASVFAFATPSFADCRRPRVNVERMMARAERRAEQTARRVERRMQMVERAIQRRAERLERRLERERRRDAYWR